MMIIPIAVSALALFLSGTDACGQTLAANETVKECREPGNFCESCTSLVSCIWREDEWVKEPLQTCVKPEKCVKGRCTEDLDVFCDGIANLTFPCTTVGIFPHPFYCDKFVLCIGEEGKYQSHVYQCEEGYSFNVKTDLCDVPLEGGVCEEDVYPVPLCLEVGQTGALEDKAAMYYLCEQYNSTNVVYPYLYVCPHGGAYQENICQDTDSTTVTTTTTTPPPVL